MMRLIWNFLSLVKNWIFNILLIQSKRLLYLGFTMTEQFFTKSIKVQKIIKGFNLTKSLLVSSILVGEDNIGKKSLIKYLFPNIMIVDGSNQKNVEETLAISNKLIIFNFEKLTNMENLNFDNKQIIAVSNYISNERIIDDLFAFIYKMPSLKDRVEDIELLVNYFIKDVKRNLMIDKLIIDLDRVDISSNTKSLRKSVYKEAFINDCTNKDIEEILYNYLLKYMNGNNDYKKYLSLYERPLIKAGLKKFYSQLKLSSILGINRNTLRKKIHELNLN